MSAPPADASLALTFSEADRELLAQVGRGPSDGPRAWRLNGQAHRLSLVQGFDRLLSWPSLHDVARYEHQVRTVLRVLRVMRGRAVLADEVGLGKTVEAGIVLKEYVIRGLARRVLILTPPALRVQWQEEMQGKFSLPFDILGSVADWDTHPMVIASLDTAKREPHAARARSILWDAVVVDEAHRLKNRESRNWRFVANLRKKYMLLLTATPIQNNMDELFNLVTLLKPGALHTYDEFQARFVGSRDGRVPARVPELRDRLRDVMVRNRRAASFELPPRRVHSLPVRLTTAERRLYDAVSDFVRDAYGAPIRRLPLTAKLTLIVLQREIGSSTFAAARTLGKLQKSTMFGSEEQERLAVLSSEAAAIRENVKAEHLRRFLASTEDQVLVFTQYLRTLEYLERVLAEDGIVPAVYHGGLRAGAKDDAVRAFRGGRRVFLSTEAGGEGRNLQFAHVLVNYDLPWNPLRIEQRIGRVHRLGQDREVHIVNLWAVDTVEEYLIELLDRKIHMFELVVGELDLILGHIEGRKSFEELLMDIWALRRAEERREALGRLGDVLVRARTHYETVKDWNATFLAPLSEEASA
ncbi:MAG TPA: SNF2-related protein [Thermoplasmata archaeon]|jgi:SNF2 family DNA or RNA helicase